MYQIREAFHSLNGKQVAVEIVRTVDDPEIPIQQRLQSESK
jgi:hypothetical protein